MTEKTEVSASPETVEEIAANVSATQIQAVQEQTALVEQSPTGITRADLQVEFDKYRGSQANYVASHFKRIEESLNTKLDEVLTPMRELTLHSEEQRISELEPEEQVEYWRQRANEPIKESPPAAISQQKAIISEGQQAQIAREVQKYADDNGVQVSYLNSAVWQGATTDMPVETLIQVAQANISTMKNRALPATTASPAVVPAVAQTPPPVSTQEAPSSSGATYGSRSEANAALLRGEIKDIDTFKSIGLSEGWYKAR
jgi:hypothetical protein